ncbi:hypothetical protein L7F22_058165 [Adiantum nelumboides]|nr:hypothetical protein [Adiantum nelumboides]
MAGSPKQGQKRGRKRPSKYLSHGHKRRRGPELRAGLQGVLITCVGGKEPLSCREAIQVLERFYDTLGEEKASIDGSMGSLVEKDQELKSQSDNVAYVKAHERLDSRKDEQPEPGNKSRTSDCEEADTNSSESEHVDKDEGLIEITRSGGPESSIKQTSIESLLEEEIADLKDVKQARFASADTGCAGVVFIRMLSSDAANGSIERGPNQVVQAILENCISTKKYLTRFCLRFLPIEVTCYASTEEVKKMAEPCLVRHFPVVEKDKAFKFAVVYEARANSSLDRMEMINTVAKLVAQPHSVDLKNPDKTILVQVVKTVCAIGVVSNYKQYAKYNIRELTSPKPESKSSV